MSNDSNHPVPQLLDESHQSLADSDAGLARVTEDLIDILITRGLIQFTDFPPAAQAKLLQRRQTRETLDKRLQLPDAGDVPI